MKLADSIAVMLRTGPRTAAELAESTGTRPASVRVVLEEMSRTREVEPGDVIRTGRRGRPARGWRLLRQVLELPFSAARASEQGQAGPAPGIGELLEADPRLNPVERRALVALIDRARTAAELRELLELRTARAARELLARLERLGLVQVVEARAGRVNERPWELTPSFLQFFGLTPDHWR